MVFVTDLGAHCAHTYPIHHLTGVTVIPAEEEGPGQDFLKCLSNSVKIECLQHTLKERELHAVIKIITKFQGLYNKNLKGAASRLS